MTAAIRQDVQEFALCSVDQVENQIETGRAVTMAEGLRLAIILHESFQQSAGYICRRLVTAKVSQISRLLE